MERFYYSPPQRNSDVDFHDVFGGPPRRSSVNETRSVSDDESEGGWCTWPREREKPVFGEDSGNRRRYHPNKNNIDFFDDIFGGEESPSPSPSVSSTPKKRDGIGNPFSNTVLSPAIPLPSPAEPSCLPAPFSLPAKLTNGAELPTFGSPTRRRNPFNNSNDGIATSNGLGSSDSHLSQRKELKNDLKPSHRQSLLSKEFSDLSISDKADKGSNMKQDISIGEVSPSTTNDHFHFSIYKWASKGVPLVMSLRTERTSRTKDKVKLERCSSATEWIVSEITTQNDSPAAYNASSLTKNRKQDVSTTSATTRNGADSQHIVEQIASAKAQSDTLSSLQTVIKDDPGCSISESSTHSISGTGFSGKTEAASESQKLASKPLHSLFTESDEKQDYDENSRREGQKIMTKSTKKSSAIFDGAVNPKKQKEKTISLRDVEHSKAASGSSSLGENVGKGRVKGKVKEFVRIFNQEAVTKPISDSKSRLQGSSYKQRGALRTKNEVEGYTEQSKKENSAEETTNMSANNLSQRDDISASAIPDISFAVIGDKDESFHGNFMIQVLAQDEGEVLENQENREIQVIDDKIQKWSKGKEGNIRSLLSTLQYVLWPESGWKPVPLVDIIEGNAVKRSYQRALLCLHPDKLQQKGAASNQKYTAEKVFDILQEAWTQFSMLSAL
ncbi:J domain-containing protein required for chloroplast accumulation response 1 isoform X2 [Gastrolobium bilobum]|uniref:J domain-containing protein required for chloroplast accumulation response 1 isoform X2 n=1 Tax=Gastrolobium bilobum TaxID=150636 RepID=UPI002AB1C63F|nr:J domain-containing protein required for chloroplast accumulation response 1 isoform X2 [Gastrolobium bilobum]